MPKPKQKSRAMTPQGQRFAALCKEREITLTYLRNQLGMSGENDIQRISHWKYRGVPTAYAIPVATILECHPSDISSIKLEQDLTPKQQKSQVWKEVCSMISTRNEELSLEQQRLLYRVVEGFFPPKS